MKLNLSRKTYKELIDILKGKGDMQSDDAMECADAICELLEKEVEVEQPQVPKKPAMNPEALSRVPDGKPIPAEKAKGNDPVPNMQGGYKDANGDYVPTGRKVTSLMGDPQF